MIQISLLRFIPESSAAVPIDWNRIPENSKNFMFAQLRSMILCEDMEECSLPRTIGGLAKSFNECKFFGYMSPELCQLLLDVSELGLKKEESDRHGHTVGPRFYMKYGSELWFLLFAPGERAGVSGYIRLPEFDDDDIFDIDAEVKIEKELAGKFDKELVKEVSRIGIFGVLMAKRLSPALETHSLERILEEAQFQDAMMTLPSHHPDRVKYERSFWASSLSRRR